MSRPCSIISWRKLDQRSQLSHGCLPRLHGFNGCRVEYPTAQRRFADGGTRCVEQVLQRNCAQQIQISCGAGVDDRVRSPTRQASWAAAAPSRASRAVPSSLMRASRPARCAAAGARWETRTRPDQRRTGHASAKSAVALYHNVRPTAPSAARINRRLRLPKRRLRWSGIALTGELGAPVLIGDLWVSFITGEIIAFNGKLGGLAKRLRPWTKVQVGFWTPHDACPGFLVDWRQEHKTNR